jgi:hypothetical protein
MRRLSESQFRIATLLLPVILVSGCMSTMGPKMPKEMSAPSLSSYSKDQFKTDVASYRLAATGMPADAAKGTAAVPPDLPRAQMLRNEIAYHVMADIESSYGGFEMKLTSGRALQGTLSDATVLGLTAATGLVGAGDMKDILAATSSAFQGSWQSYDKNFFRDKTAESIISQMRATRKTLQAQLIKNLGTRDVTSYPWDAAWIDLIDFYYAGTVPSALVEIATTSGAKADEATKTLSNAVASLTPCTPAQSSEFFNVRKVYFQLAALVGDQTKAETAVAPLQQILNGVGVTPDPSAAPATLLKQFDLAIKNTNCDDSLKNMEAVAAGANIP